MSIVLGTRSLRKAQTEMTGVDCPSKKMSPEYFGNSTEWAELIKTINSGRVDRIPTLRVLATSLVSVSETLDGKEAIETGRNLNCWDRAVIKNPLKELSWIVSHNSFFNGKLIISDEMKRVLPIGTVGKKIWNGYIMSMTDLSEEEKKKFLFNFASEKTVVPISSPAADKNDSGTKLLEMLSKVSADDIEKIISALVPKTDTKSEEVETIPPTTADVITEEEVVADEKESFSSSDDRVEKETPVEKETVEIETIPPAPIVAPEEETMVDKKETSSSQDNRAEKEAPVEKDDAEVITEKIVNDVPDFVYDPMTKSFHDNVPQLQKLTDIAIRNGKSVTYFMENEVFPGLIHARISEGNKFERELIVDPYMIYGDTLRLIYPTCDDIRKGIFIAISQTNYIEKAINGTIDQDDIRNILDELPKSIVDFREKYTLIDRVDLSSLVEKFKRTVPDSKKQETVYVPFKLWRAFITNISNILRDKNIPLCRFRLEEYSSPNNFTLVCDNGVRMNYRSTIFEEASCIAACRDKLFVEYNTNKYKDRYTYGKITPFN